MSGQSDDHVDCPRCAGAGNEPSGRTCGFCGGHGSVSLRRRDELPRAVQIPLGLARRLTGCLLAVAGAVGFIVGALVLRFGGHPGLVRHFGQHQLLAGLVLVIALPAFVAGCYLAGRLAVAVTGALTMLAGGAIFVIGMRSDDPRFDLFPLLGPLIGAVGTTLLAAGIAEKLKGKKAGW